MAKLIIDGEWCKGCMLCVSVCKLHGIRASKKLNEKGYFPAEKDEAVACNGCGLCVLVCADIAIEIEDDDE
jgi:2-oxoglutarate ferredoxin oxidoreductase subunit delta